MPDAPLPVIATSGSAAMPVQSITISGATGVDINGTLQAAGTQNGKPYWTTGGVALAAIDDGAYAGYNGTGWDLKLYTDGTPDGTNYWSTTQDHATPDMVTSWTAHGTAGGTLAIAIDRPAAPLAEASAAEPPTPVQPLAEGSAGADYKPITVSGTLTSDGSTPVVFPALLFSGAYQEGPSWTDTGNTPVGDNYDYLCCYPTGVGWTLSKYSGETLVAIWVSSADVTTPDQVPTGAWNGTTNPTAWKPTSPATGTPVIAIDRPLPIV